MFDAHISKVRLGLCRFLIELSGSDGENDNWYHQHLSVNLIESLLFSSLLGDQHINTLAIIDGRKKFELHY